MGRRGLIVLAAGALLALAPAHASADQATCSYDAATHTAAIGVTHSPGPGTGVSFNLFSGALSVNNGSGTVPCGAATRTNTDTISVKSTNVAPTGSVFRVGLLVPPGPGFTDEPGNSDEIEMAFDFSSGGRWYLTPTNTSALGGPLDIALGGNQLNFNGSETDGVDADATVTGATKVYVEGSPLADLVLAGGGAGTPGPFAIPLVVSSGAGADRLVGGSGRDDLSGGLDADTVAGGGGKDALKGEGASDTLFGGAGNDKLLGGPAKDKLRGGPGRRDRCTTKQDSDKGCEVTTADKR